MITIRHRSSAIAAPATLGAFVALALLTGATPGALACDACANNNCTPGFAQGTYGCRTIQAQCTVISQIFGTCKGTLCDTTGAPPCDNIKPPPKEPQKDPKKDEIGLFSSGACDDAPPASGWALLSAPASLESAATPAPASPPVPAPVSPPVSPPVPAPKSAAEGR